MADPIRWTKKNDRAFERPAFKWEDGVRTAALDDLGRPLKERVPVTGRVGVVKQKEDVANTKPMGDAVSIHVMRYDNGAEVHVPIRSAAAAKHGDQGTDRSLLEFRRAGFKHYGWIIVGSCPVDLVLRRELTKLQLVSVEVRAAVDKGEACSPKEVGSNKPPCRHYKAEKLAREGVRAAENAEQVLRHKPASERTAETLGEFVQAFAAGQAQAAATPAAEQPPAPESKPASKAPTK